MILLTPTETAPSHAHPVAIFGTGLIGSAIADTYAAHVASHVHQLDLDWQDPGRQSAALATIRRAIESALTTDEGRGCSLVYSAGRAGFASTWDQTRSELQSFQRVLELAEYLVQAHPDVAIQLILVSSVGGLFEGQRHITRQSVPAPLRPYGQLKQRQEELLQAAAPELDKRIYRLTSVFGPIRSQQRRGLISAMLANGVRGRATPITGHLTTLRDFVWVGDIAAAIVRDILDVRVPFPEPVRILGSGKPSTIQEMIHLIERIIRRRIYVHFLPHANNSDDITVAATALPPDWHPSDLAGNILWTFRDAVAKGAFFEPT